MKLTTHLYLVLELRINAAIILPPICLHICRHLHSAFHRSYMSSPIHILKVSTLRILNKLFNYHDSCYVTSSSYQVIAVTEYDHLYWYL
jgi:hypothetical protein